MEATVDERRELLAQDLDFAGLEQAITAQMNALGAELVKQVVEPLLVDEDYVERLKGLGGQRGLKFKEYRVVRVRLGTGASLFLAWIGPCGRVGGIVVSAFPPA